MPEDFHEMLGSKISVHDRHRFEIKMDVELTDSPKNIYRVETYFFVPRALNIHPGTYTKSDFYNSSQRYIRFKTPQMSLDAANDATKPNSPLAKIKAGVTDILSGDKSPEKTEMVYNEIKLLGCVSRAAVRNHAQFLAREIDIASAGTEGGVRLNIVDENIKSFAGDVRRLVRKTRELKVELSNPVIPRILRDAFNFFDEFMSLMLVEYLTGLLKTMRKEPAAAARLKEADGLLAAIVTGQDEYRKSMGFKSVIEKGSRNEQVVYRKGVLKKFISSILYLQIETYEWEGAFQLFFGLAAAAAMLFTVLVMLVAQSRYAVDSIPFILSAVISYAFKDRIKDWLKLWFTRRWTSWIADRKTAIRDSHLGKEIGSIKEAFSFVTSENIPGEILSRRNIDNLTSVDEDGKPERVMKYEKEVTILPGRIAKLDERRRSLNDIQRFSILPFLAQADDPEIPYLYLDPASREIETLECSRTYHINAVTKYIFYDAQKKPCVSFERVRMVVTKQGIIRFDKVPVA